MTLNEIEDFLIRISKDEKANSKLADAMSCVLMKQALFFNIVLMLIITGVFFIQDMSVWGGIVGLFIISSMLVYRIKKIKNEYLKDVKKIAKKEKIHLFSDFLVDIYELLLRRVEVKFVTGCLLTEEISKDAKKRVNEYLVNNKEQLTYNELKHCLNVLKDQKEKNEYIILKKYFEENKNKLLGDNFKEF
tara:strand:- start:7398 stop:7967 length:570 start_codon:yes stop_codon:yes gene_type:complete